MEKKIKECNKIYELNLIQDYSEGILTFLDS